MSALNYDDSQFEVFNLGGSETVTLNALIELLEKALGKDARINTMPAQPGDVPLTRADVSKARAMLGYEPQTSIREGVAKFVEWYRGTLRP